MKAVKTTHKAATQVHKYCLDGDGVPLPVQLKDVPAQGYSWGILGGLALVVDLFSWRDVLTPDQLESYVTEYVRSMMEKASEELASESNSDCDDRRGVAVGVLDGFAALVAHALESGKARTFMTTLLNDSVIGQEQMEAAEQAREKALALNIHGIAHQKGGLRHE